MRIHQGQQIILDQYHQRKNYLTTGGKDEGTMIWEMIKGGGLLRREYQPTGDGRRGGGTMGKR